MIINKLIITVALVIACAATATAMWILPLSSAAGESSVFTIGGGLFVLFFLGALLAGGIALRFGAKVGTAAVTKTPTARPVARSAPAAGQEEGTVKWFNAKKGFGFICRDNGEDVFVHFRSVQGGNRYLKPGQSVRFTVVDGEKGKQAEDVELLD